MLTSMQFNLEINKNWSIKLFNIYLPGFIHSNSFWLFFWSVLEESFAVHVKIEIGVLLRWNYTFEKYNFKSLFNFQHYLLFDLCFNRAIFGALKKRRRDDVSLLRVLMKGNAVIKEAEKSWIDCGHSIHTTPSKNMNKQRWGQSSTWERWCVPIQVHVSNVNLK